MSGLMERCLRCDVSILEARAAREGARPTVIFSDFKEFSHTGVGAPRLLIDRADCH